MTWTCVVCETTWERPRPENTYGCFECGVIEMTGWDRPDPTVAMSDYLTIVEGRLKAAEQRIAELLREAQLEWERAEKAEGALKAIVELSSQDVPFTAVDGVAGEMRKIARRALNDARDEVVLQAARAEKAEIAVKELVEALRELLHWRSRQSGDKAREALAKYD